MKTNTKQIIIDTINSNGSVTAHQLQEILNLSNVSIHKHLKKLVQEDKITKAGKPPFVVYLSAITKKVSSLTIQDKKITKFIDQNYLYISPTGNIYSGTQGFFEWITKTKQEKKVNQLAKEYVKTKQEANKFYNNNTWIDATQKMKDTFKKIYVNKVFYQDFYSLPKFGKTKLGNLVLYAKQTQNKQLIKKIAKEIQPSIKAIIKEYNIETVLYIPHSIPRKIPFLKHLKEQLKLNSSIKLYKAYAGEVPVAQKSLKKLEDRVANAKETIFLNTKDVNYKRILLIDDAVGSGATLNETAKKLKKYYKVDKVYSYAVVGSYKGFEVISEV